MVKTKTWQQIAEYAWYAPSPHNTQPFRLRGLSDSEAEVVFIPARGLFVADPKGKFTWLTAGIFVEICRIAAHSLGFELEIKWQFSPMYKNNDYETEQVVGQLTLKAGGIIPDIDAALIMRRHTSRLPYDGRLIPEAVKEELQAEAKRLGHIFNISTEPRDIAWVKILNKNSLFNDLADKGIRDELKKWLRYSKQEARAKKDGLSAECLHLQGWLLHSFFYHHRFWTFPGLKAVVDRIYLSTMKGVGTIGWLQGKYTDMNDWVDAGQVMIRLWLILTCHGIYWQPYGSIITNDTSRTEMLRHLGLSDEAGGDNMVWLLLRMGYSKEPPRSERLPVEEILL